MNESCEGSEEGDVFYMVFFIQNRLIKVRDAPSLRDRVVKKGRKFFRSLPCDCVSPGPERNEELPVFVKGKVAVHHGRKAQCPDFFELDAVFFFYITL